MLLAHLLSSSTTDYLDYVFYCTHPCTPPSYHNILMLSHAANQVNAKDGWFKGERSANPKDEQQMVRSLAEELSAPTTNSTPADIVLANKDAVVVQSTHLTAAAAKGQVGLARQATSKHAAVGKIPIKEATALVVQAPHEKHADKLLRSSRSTQEEAVAEYPDNCIHTAGLIDHCLTEIPSSEVTPESIFALIDIDQSGSVNIEEISNAIGQDLRDRGQLQELFPDLMNWGFWTDGL